MKSISLLYSSMWLTPQKTTLFLFILFAVFSSIKCNVQGAPDVHNQLRVTKPSVKTTLSALYLERNKFLDLENASKKYKLIVQFYHKSSSGELAIALHPAARQNQGFDKEHIQYPTPFMEVMDITNEDVFLGDQQLKPDEYIQLLKEIKDDATIQFILFMPAIDQDNHVYYTLTGSATKTISAFTGSAASSLSTVGTSLRGITTSIQSKPSPPAAAL